MCSLGCHLQVSGVLLLMVSAALTRASSYRRASGAKEMWPYFRIKCDLKCQYGYQTDVEGNYVCLCHDPCQNVRCFGNTECVVDESKMCSEDNCRPHATCRAISGLPPNLPTPPTTPQSPQSRLQADDAATTSAEATVPEVCLLPVEEEAKLCRKTRTRWFYDNVSGTCRPFEGCRMGGNNFRRQKGCERVCLWTRKASKKSRVQAAGTTSVDAAHKKRPQVRQAAPPTCLLPAVPSTSGCTRLRKRWFFDANTGTCRKFRSCSTPGNNFSKKRHCKSRCLGKKKSSRRKGRRSARQSAVQ